MHAFLTDDDIQLFLLTAAAGLKLVSAAAAIQSWIACVKGCPGSFTASMSSPNPTYREQEMNVLSLFSFIEISANLNCIDQLSYQTCPMSLFFVSVLGNQKDIGRKEDKYRQFCFWNY